MKHLSRLSGLALLALAQTPYAQTPNHPTAGAPLNPIVVTATRTAQAADRALASVTVISREQLEQRQSHTLAEALDGQAGLQFSNTGGAGKVTTLFMRGTESDQVLVMIDGVKVGSATHGLAAFEHIPVDQIERVEVVRGPRASLYGSEAIGGVIQIFTRNGKQGGQQSASLSVGAHDFLGGSVYMSERFENSWVSLGADYQRTAGIDSCQGPIGGCFNTEPDRDGYKRRAGSFRFGHQLTNNIEIGLHHLQSEGDNEFDGNFTNEADFYQQVSGGKVTWEATDAWTVTARAGINKDESENEINGVFASRFDSQRITRSLQSDYRLTDDQLVTLGYDFHDDQIDSSNAFVETSRRNEGVFGQYQTQIGQWSLQASGRRDSNEQFGSHETGSLAIGYSADNGVNTLVSHGTAYKAPTFNELYFPFFGNPGLDPEESRSTELGFSGSTDRYDWSANFFHTSVDELISFDSVIFAPANLSEATIRGAEFQLRTEIAGWSIDSQVSFLDAKNNDSGANNDKLLPRRARRSLRIDADQSAGQWHYGGTLIARGRAYDDLANTDSIGGFVTLDLRTAYQLNRQFQLQLKVNNLLDKKYSTASQFNQDGTHLMMTLRWQQPG